MLRIQFFGSDIFSIKSLLAVLNVAKTRPDLVQSVQVVTRTQKPSGRGQNTITNAPIVDFAEANKIEWIESETSQDFENLLKFEPSMAIAVSYGRLIPAEYLSKIKFGGLNVHPSLLPTFRGAAPLHRAIMQRVPYTGVSVQTLDPFKFDRGKILWQSDKILLHPSTHINQLRLELADVGATGLGTVLTDQLYLGNGIQSTNTPSWARVVTKSEHRLNVATSVLDTVAKCNALEKLYFEQPLVKKKKQPQTSRTLISQIRPLEVNDGEVPGTIKIIDNMLAIKLGDGYIGASTVQAAGFKQETPTEYASKLKKRGLELVAL